MSIYGDIISAQTSKGNLGGKKGPLGKDKSDDSKTRVEFFIITAKVFEAFDSNGKADPYVKIGRPTSKDGSIKWFAKTPVKKETLEPSYSYTHIESLDLTKVKKLLIEIWDHDVLSKDDFIGSCEIDISQLVDEEHKYLYHTYDLFKKDDKSKPIANVYMSITLK